MKTVLLLLVTFTQIQAIAKTNNPLEILQQEKIENSWIAYKVPAQENTQSMCCWSQKGVSIIVNSSNNYKFESCDLNSKSHGYGTTDKSPITENINVYVQVKHGKIKQILSVGDSCEIKASKQKISWVSNIDESKSIKFLENVTTNSKEDIAHDALYAISHHKSHEASLSLYEIALKNNNDISENAVFWLGEARYDGVDYLKKLYQNLPKGEVKQKINFALSQAKNEQAIDMLKSIAKNDKDAEQRSDAIFWLSQNDIMGIVPFLLTTVESDSSTEVQEKAVFSLSQVETESAANALVKLAQTHQRKNIREKALFWLVEVNPKKAKHIILKILKNNIRRDEQDNAVFTLSRIDEESGEEGLFEILTGDYSKAVKKKALFWLAQSDDKKTIDRLQTLL